MKTVLIADDDENDVFFLRRLLAKQADCQIHVARDGAQVIRYLMGVGEYTDRALFPEPSCVILDLRLPQKDGLEILEWMQGNAAFAKIPTLICSGMECEKHLERARQLGAHSFSPKPPDPLQVQRVMAAGI